MLNRHPGWRKALPGETPGSCEPELETELAGWPPRTADGHIDVAAILALLPDEDPGENPWGSTNLAYFDEAGNLVQPT